jgi:hypothetical protein
MLEDRNSVLSRDRGFCFRCFVQIGFDTRQIGHPKVMENLSLRFKLPEFKADSSCPFLLRLRLLVAKTQFSHIST